MLTGGGRRRSSREEEEEAPILGGAGTQLVRRVTTEPADPVQGKARREGVGASERIQSSTGMFGLNSLVLINYVNTFSDIGYSKFQQKQFSG